ncbi:TPA: thymidylate synthase [Enterobacter asburiae]|nr:thymidylate synthase [Enterobacter asburiae]
MTSLLNKPFTNGLATDYTYRSVISRVQSEGMASGDRTGTGTKGTCFLATDYLLTGASVPLVSSKKTNLKPLLVELEWYLKGTGNIGFLKEHGVKIWDAWADENDDLGPVYGKQWRSLEDTRIILSSDLQKYLDRGYLLETEIDEKRSLVTRNVDQLARIVNTLRTNPSDRRMLMSAWNMAQLEDMALPPCHFAFYVWSRELDFPTRLSMASDVGRTHSQYGHESMYSRLLELLDSGTEINDELMDNLGIPKRVLCSSVMQRSVDVFVGMPFNIAGYGILTHFIAQITGHMAASLTHYGCDVHLYDNHQEAVEEFQARELPKSSDPVVILPEAWEEIDDFRWDGVVVEGYEPLPWIKVPVAV